MTEVIAAARGYVLTGGGSSRMGRDKARLPFRGSTLVEWVAGRLQEAVGAVTLVGAPERYADLGLEAIGESHAGLGPLSGIEAALGHSGTELNLIVACDMPHLNVADLRGLVANAAAADADVCATAGGPDGAEPLCAVYHRRCLADVRSALGEGRLKVFELYAGWRVRLWEPGDPLLATNINDLGDWRRLVS